MENSTLLLLGAVVLGGIAGYYFQKVSAGKARSDAEDKTKRALEEAEVKAKEIVREAKEKAATLIADFKREEKERTNQISALETRLIRREEILDKKLVSLGDEEKAITAKAEAQKAEEEKLKNLQGETIKQLEKIAGLTASAAKDELMKGIKETYEQEIAQMIQKLDKERRDEVEKRALDIITVALQRYARSHVSEITTSVFPLEDEELKGKIIGREGRNIRTLERATGVEFVIDETPDTTVISSFDPYRREVARLALQKLVKDGRIQPAKIEEKVEEAKQELAKRIQEVGDAAA